MNPATLTALRGSIRKWEKIVDGSGADEGSKNCPLCQLYNTGGTTSGSECEGCPVLDATGLPFCIGTPYVENWATLHGGPWPPEYANTPALKAAARKELKFLRSLLPGAAT